MNARMTIITIAVPVELASGVLLHLGWPECLLRQDQPVIESNLINFYDPQLAICQ